MSKTKTAFIDELTELFYEIIDNWQQPFKGGCADGIHPNEVDEEELFLGFLDEVQEHGINEPYIAMKVALDHIVKDENYYSRKTIIKNPVEKDIECKKQLALICQAMHDELKRFAPRHNLNDILTKLQCIAESPESVNIDTIRNVIKEGRKYIEKYWKNPSDIALRKGCIVKIKRQHFTGNWRKPKFIGETIHTVKILKDSYGSKRGQHTFTLQDIESGEKWLVKGRNLYPNVIEVIFQSEQSKKDTH